uniref:RDD domain-containing protein n=1 Tax=Capra hircus TaxID=9925 RepID=A0A8C2RIJ2_CAPHI
MQTEKAALTPGPLSEILLLHQLFLQEQPESTTRETIWRSLGPSTSLKSTRGREYVIPSLAHRFMAEMVDFFILFFIKATIVLSIMHLSGIKSTIRALIKNFSIASFFPAFITLLFFQHNRTAYDIVAGTIVVKRNGVR